MTESSPCFHSPLCVRIASHFRTGYSTAYGHPHPCVTNDCHSAIFCQTPSLWCSTAVFYTPNQPNIIHVIFSESVGSSRSRRGESRSRRELRGPLLGQFSERLSPLELHDSPLLEICHPTTRTVRRKSLLLYRTLLRRLLALLNAIHNIVLI